MFDGGENMQCGQGSKNGAGNFMKHKQGMRHGAFAKRRGDEHGVEPEVASRHHAIAGYKHRQMSNRRKRPRNQVLNLTMTGSLDPLRTINMPQSGRSVNPRLLREIQSAIQKQNFSRHVVRGDQQCHSLRNILGASRSAHRCVLLPKLLRLRPGCRKRRIY